MSSHQVQLTLLLDSTRQTIEGFGASDAWGCEHLGADPGRQREAAAELLFSAEKDEDGTPLGAGLSSWRFTLGAGSTRTAEGPAWTQMDTFLREDWSAVGTLDARAYDFTRCPGQRWFLDAARRYGVDHYVASVRAPPHVLARPSLVGGVLDAEAPGTWEGTTRPPCDPAVPPPCSLQTQAGIRVTEFVQYIAKVLEFLARNGVVVSAIAPCRAPSAFSVGECCTWRNGELAALCTALCAELDARGLPGAVCVPEAAAVDLLSQRVPGLEHFSSFVADFFGTGDVPPPPRLRVVSGSSCLSCWPHCDRLVGSRERLAAVMRGLLRHNVRYWMSEYVPRVPEGDARVPDCVVQAARGRDGPLGDPGGMGAALWVARVIHADLSIAGAALWHWGPAVGGRGHDDGLLAHLASREAQAPATKKVLWAVAHWSHFVRPGMRRVELLRSDAASERDGLTGLLATSFVEPPPSGYCVAVCVNAGEADREVALSASARPGDPRVIPHVSGAAAYLTDAGTSMTPFAGARFGQAVRVPARSIVTLAGYAVCERVAYRIMAAATQQPLCLTVCSDGGDRSVIGLGRAERGSLAQLWVLADTGTGAVTISSLLTGNFLGVTMGNVLPSAPLTQDAVAATTFRVEHLQSGHVLIIAYQPNAPAGGHALEAYGDAVRAQRRNSRRQQWWLFDAAADEDPAPLPLGGSLRRLGGFQAGTPSTEQAQRSGAELASLDPRARGRRDLNEAVDALYASAKSRSSELRTPLHPDPEPVARPDSVPAGQLPTGWGGPPPVPADASSPRMPPHEQHSPPIAVQPPVPVATAATQPQWPQHPSFQQPPQLPEPSNVMSATMQRALPPAGGQWRRTRASSGTRHDSWPPDQARVPWRVPADYGPTEGHYDSRVHECKAHPNVAGAVGRQEAAPPQTRFRQMPDLDQPRAAAEPAAPQQSISPHRADAAASRDPPPPAASPSSMGSPAMRPGAHQAKAQPARPPVQPAPPQVPAPGAFSFTPEDPSPLGGTRQEEIDRRALENRLQRKAERDREVEELKKEREGLAQKALREKQEQEEKMHEKLMQLEQRASAARAKRRGTSHLVLTLNMRRSEFDDKFSEMLRDSIGRSLELTHPKDEVVLIPFPGTEDAQGSRIKVEVRLRHMDPSLASDRLNKLARLMAAPGKQGEPGQEGVHPHDDTSDDSAGKREKEKTTKRKGGSKS